MKIDFIGRSIIGSLVVKHEGTTIEHDIVEKINDEWVVPDSEIEGLITIIFEMRRFNNKSDVDTVKMIYDAFLNDKERVEFQELIESK